MHSLVEPNTWVCLRLTSSTLKLIQVVPNSIINLPKYGSFSANLLLSRPYNLTYELLDRPSNQKHSLLRIVPASELHADTIAEESSSFNPFDPSLQRDGVEYQLDASTGEVLLRSNREIFDSASRQTLTMEEIEELKRQGTGAGKDLIEKLMASHLGIEQKTAFSLAKYKLMKTRKYLKRFTVLPVDVPLLTQWVLEEKDAVKILEMREEMLALVMSWSNIHFSSIPESLHREQIPLTGRWLCVDETGGLLVAALAERMGILYPILENMTAVDAQYASQEFSSFATSSTITLIHNNAQPNLSLLKYFSYTPDIPNTPNSHNHPLTRHLLTLSWLQLLSPHLDNTYSSPIAPLSTTALQAMKSNKRATYHRKLRRCNRVHSTVDQTRQGDFDGLVVASWMDPISILRPTLPLLKGGAMVVVYSPNIEGIAELCDVFSMSRRTAFIQSPPLDFLSLPSFTPPPQPPSTPAIAPITAEAVAPMTKATWPGNADFPLNPTLLLNTTVQTARLRPWQVLPGRTHPAMTGRGGAEGFLFTGVRVLPAEGRVEARGKFFGKRKTGATEGKNFKTEGEVEVKVEVEIKAGAQGGGDDEDDNGGARDSEERFGNENLQLMDLDVDIKDKLEAES